jgi:uncharacterized membrane protein YtjA (UPF0391 family)
MSLALWSAIAFLVSVVCGALGFSGRCRRAADLAKVLFAIFLILSALLLVLAILGVTSGPSEPAPGGKP